MKVKLKRILEDRQADKEARRAASKLWEICFYLANKVTDLTDDIVSEAKQRSEKSYDDKWQIWFDKNGKMINNTSASASKVAVSIDSYRNEIQFMPHLVDKKLLESYVSLRPKGTRRNTVGSHMRNAYGEFHQELINVDYLPSNTDLNDFQDLWATLVRLPEYVKKAKSTIVHEYIHALDVDRIGPDYTPMSGKHHAAGDRDKYFNDPLEFNAFYQEGTETLWEVFDERRRKNLPMIPHKFKEQYWDNPNARPPELDYELFLDLFIYRDIKKNDYGHPFRDVGSPFRQDFLKKLDRKNEKRLKKRLYQEYRELVKKGFWKLGEDEYFATVEDPNDPHKDQRRF